MKTRKEIDEQILDNVNGGSSLIKSFKSAWDAVTVLKDSKSQKK